MKILINTLAFFVLIFFLGIGFNACSKSKIKKHKDKKPNVILVMSDDQGYGDLGCHGNSHIKTPNLDRFYEQSIRFTDFHVGTTCSPTRAGLMTGRYNNAVGAWHTLMSRYMIRKDETTIADLFLGSGYETAMFGKWHLGDNFPYRPQDRGFKTTVIHGGGGVGQSPDYWNNDYFDDTYLRNGKPEKFTGYCTDIWFNEATKFIENNTDKPFFCYISTNAPHGPFHVDSTYIKPYLNNKIINNPNFYGMISNIDENFGKLEARLNELKIADNTILIYMTDNGTSAGISNGYNAGMRGGKASPYDGGHRVPFFIRWKDGEISGGRDLSKIAGYTDILPTLLDLCGIELTKDIQLHGKSLKPLLQGADVNWPERTLFADTQRELYLKKWNRTAVMTKRWRLVNENELYDMTIDPGQKNNVSDFYPEVVMNLKQEYDKWWERVTERSEELSSIPIDSSGNSTRLTSFDCNGQRMAAWNQVLVRKGSVGNGFWMVDFTKPGMYSLKMYRYPKESGLRLGDSEIIGESVDGGKPYPEGKILKIVKAGIKLGNYVNEIKIDSNSLSANLIVPMSDIGEFKLQLWFELEDGTKMVPYYTYVNKVDNLNSSLK